jgi:CRISPR-associated protein Cmr1
MPRSLGDRVPVWEEPQREAATEIKLHLKTITPLFGGNAVTRTVNAKNPVRVSSIRGHLRFWWRATVGARFTTPTDLSVAETKIFGSTETPSPVQIRISQLQAGEEAPVRDYQPNSAQNGPQATYFLFPFNENKRERLPAANGRKNVAFTLTVTLNGLEQKQQDELIQAIRAWLCFGGIGSRTRRGCGALTVTKDASHWLPDSQDMLKKWFQYAAQEGEPKTTLLAGGTVLIGTTPSSAEACWQKLGKFWARFHKGHFHRDYPYNPMKGVLWQDHDRLLAFEKTPTAAISLIKPYLGMPIIYQEFPQAIPRTFSETLETVETGRMASPIILKPVAFADGKIYPLIAVLNAPAPTNISLYKKNKKQGKKVTLSVNTADSVLTELNARSPLDAVIKAAKRDLFEGQPEIRL